MGSSKNVLYSFVVELTNSRSCKVPYIYIYIYIYTHTHTHSQYWHGSHRLAAYRNNTTNRLYYYYYFRLLILFRQQQAFSKENFCKPRGPQHTCYYIVVIIVAEKKMHEREKWVHWRITETPKREVTSRDWTLWKEQKKSCAETGEQHVIT